MRHQYQKDYEPAAVSVLKELMKIIISIIILPFQYILRLIRKKPTTGKPDLT